MAVAAATRHSYMLYTRSVFERKKIIYDTVVVVIHACTRGLSTLQRLQMCSRATIASSTWNKYQLIDNYYSLLAASIVVVFFTLTDRASTIPSNIRGCQSGTWAQRGTEVNGSHHGDNPLLRIFLPTRATRSGERARFVGLFQGCTGLWTAGCWLARQLHQLKASTTMDLGISIFLIFVRCVALRNLEYC